MTTQFQYIHITPKSIRILGIILIMFLLISLTVMQAQAAPATAPLRQTSCTLPATVTTAAQLRDCITTANANGAGLDTITLGADINLTLNLPQITTAIMLEGAGYALDGGGSRQIFNIGGVGDLTIKNAILRNGFATNGGAVANDGTLTLINSTLSGNTANSGGAVFNALVSTVTATNSTFSGNTATASGGAIYSISPLILTYNTFAGNAAPAGSSLYSFSSVYLAGNIFAAGVSAANCFSSTALNDNGYNLSDDATCTNGGFGSQTNATLNLGALTDNGGLTPTHLPGAGSAAIGAIHYGYVGNNNGTLLACNHSTTDQIGQNRPLSANIACTSGAVEATSTVASLTIIKDASPANGTDFDFTLNAAPLTSYSGTTNGKPFWTRPNEGTTCTLSAVSTRYHVQAFVVDTSGSYNLESSQSGFNGYIHLYQDSFNPIASCTNYLNGDDNVLIGGSSGIYGQFLEAGRTYYFVTSGNNGFDAGNFTNSIIGAGTAYTLNEAFTLDDAVPDDGDGVAASATFSVAPGTYSITEILPNDAWRLSGATCSGAGGTVSLTDETLSVEVSSGEAVQCTFTNELLCPASWTVTTADELFGCIALANANESPSPTADTITLGANINLNDLTTTPLPQITSEITLEGDGHTIDGGWDGASGSGTGIQIFYVTSTGRFTVNQATLQHGIATEGGAIHNHSGTVTVTNSIFIGNDANDSVWQGGGAIYNFTDGLVTVSDSTFVGNSATAGGAIYNAFFRSTLIITNSTFANNTADDGGALYNSPYNTTLIVSNSTFTNNAATNGGAIVHDGDNNTHVTIISNSTFSGNTATTGGAIYKVYGVVTVSNSTFSGNSATTTGGIYVGQPNGALTVSNSTFSGNLGGGISAWTPNLAANIFVAGATGDNCTILNAINDNGYNLSDDTTCTNGGLGSRTNAHLNLEPLADNGGPTLTHLPGTASDAIGAIPNGATISNNGTTWTCNDANTFTDQRGEPRPSSSGYFCAAGAVEVSTPPICPSWTATTADELYDCIRMAIANGPSLDTITLGADINLAGLTNSSLPQIQTAITLAGAGHTIDGNNSLQLFYVTSIGNFTVNQSTLRNGSAANGGAIYNEAGMVTASNSTFSGNSTTGDGGAIYNFEGGTVTVSSSTFTGNTAADDGGAIFGQTHDITLTVSNSTFTGNSATNGGAIADSTENASAVTTISNSTFSGNTATGSGGALYVTWGQSTMTHNTFVGNSATNGGAVFAIRSYRAGNIFAASVSGGNCNSPATFTDNGYNLSDDSTCTNGGPGSATNATLNLDVLADNGGATWTHALLPGSEAIDVIPGGSCLTATDQRGVSRPINGLCDSGAYEGGTMVCSVSALTTYTFPEQSGISIYVVSSTDLGCIYVEEVPISHPQATGDTEGTALKTGKYWRIRGLQADGNTTASTYTVNLTLTHANVNNPQACKYTGGAGYGWQCAANASTSSTVTRNGLTSFSDWAVGSDVGPTAVTLQSITVTSTRQAGVWLAVLMLGVITAVGLWRRRAGQPS